MTRHSPRLPYPPPRIAATLLLVANLLFFWPVLFHGRVFSSHDVVLATYPWRGVSGVTDPRDRLLADPATASETQLMRFRNFPRGFFWNRATSCGSPGPINFVQGNLSPFFWLPAMTLPEAGIETGILFLKFNAGFFFAYLFLRRRRFSDLAASAGAATWAWTSAQSSWWLWMQTSVSIFFPLLLLAVDVALESRSFARAAALASIIGLGALAGGYPFWIFFGAFAAALYALFRASEFGARRTLRAAGRLATGAALSVAIVSPAMLLSYRFLRETGHIEFRRGIGTRNPMPLRQARFYFLPEYRGDPLADDYTGVGLGAADNYFETAVAVGPFALGLAGLGLASRRRRRLMAYCAALGLFIAIPLYAGGPILGAIGALPGFSSSPFERAKILIVLAIAIGCAAGTEVAEDIFRHAPLIRRGLSMLPHAIAVPLVFLAAKSHPAVLPSAAVFRDTPGIRVLRERGQNGPTRFFATGWTLFPSLAEALGLEDLRGHLWHEASYRTLLRAADPLVYGATGTLLIFHGDALDTGAPILDFLNAASVAAPPGVSRPDSREAMEKDAGYALPPAPPNLHPPRAPLARVYSGADMTIFDRPTVFPRFFPVARAASGGADTAARADRETLRSTAFISGTDLSPLDTLLRSSRPAEASIRMVTDEDEHFEVAVSVSTPILLASSQKRFEPYWQTRIDGKPVASLACDGPFLAVLVPAGRHRLTGAFRFPRTELALSAIGALVLLGVAVRAVAIRNRAV